MAIGQSDACYFFFFFILLIRGMKIKISQFPRIFSNGLIFICIEVMSVCDGNGTGWRECAGSTGTHYVCMNCECVWAYSVANERIVVIFSNLRAKKKIICSVYAAWRAWEYDIFDRQIHIFMDNSELWFNWKENNKTTINQLRWIITNIIWKVTVNICWSCLSFNGTGFI